MAAKNSENQPNVEPLGNGVQFEVNANTNDTSAVISHATTTSTIASNLNADTTKPLELSEDISLALSESAKSEDKTSYIGDNSVLPTFSCPQRNDIDDTLDSLNNIRQISDVAAKEVVKANNECNKSLEALDSNSMQNVVSTPDSAEVSVPSCVISGNDTKKQQFEQIDKPNDAPKELLKSNENNILDNVLPTSNTSELCITSSDLDMCEGNNAIDVQCLHPNEKEKENNAFKAFPNMTETKPMKNAETTSSFPFVPTSTDEPSNAAPTADSIISATASAIPLHFSFTNNISAPEVTDLEEKCLDKSAEIRKRIQDSRLCDLLGNGEVVMRLTKIKPTSSYPKISDCAVINYVAQLVDDRIVEEKQNMEIHVRDFELALGLDFAVFMMRIGEKAEVVVSPAYAFGDEGDEKLSVPPGSYIIYTIELLSVETEQKQHFQTILQRQEMSLRKRTRANYWFKRRNYFSAIHLYQRAIYYLESGIEENEFSAKDFKDLENDKAVANNNLAMAYLKLYCFADAYLALQKVLEVQPTNAKALYRKGLALYGMREIEGAIAQMRLAAIHAKNKAPIEKELKKMSLELSRERGEERKLYKKMLSLEDKEKQPQKPQVKKASSFSLNQKLAYGMGVVLLATMGYSWFHARC